MTVQGSSRTMLVGAAALACLLAGCGDSGKKNGASTQPAPSSSNAMQSSAPPAAGGTMTAADDAAPAAMIPLDIVDKSGAKMSGDPVKGESTFHQCAVCHTIDPGVNKIGPSLHGIIDRPAGQVADFSYSDANKNSGKVWNQQTIFDYLENPRAYIPGTKMSFAGLTRPQDRANVVAYLVQNTK